VGRKLKREEARKSGLRRGNDGRRYSLSSGEKQAFKRLISRRSVVEVGGRERGRKERKENKPWQPEPMERKKVTVSELQGKKRERERWEGGRKADLGIHCWGKPGQIVSTGSGA
jgi:hypothetical protein